MILTFGQYNILTATRHCVNRTQLSEHTNFDRTLVSYLITGLVRSGLLNICNEGNEEQTFYELTDAGMNCIEEYERENPDLVINRLTI
jgi:predicted transcriptional regulator